MAASTARSPEGAKTPLNRAVAPLRRGAGRPTKYRPEYCEIVESLGAKGKSPAEIAAILNVDRASLYRWASQSEEFAQSLARAKTFEQAYWEQLGRDALHRERFQAGVWRTSMAARFPEDYSQGGHGRSASVKLGEVIEGLALAVNKA